MLRLSSNRFASSPAELRLCSQLATVFPQKLAKHRHESPKNLSKIRTLSPKSLPEGGFRCIGLRQGGNLRVNEGHPTTPSPHPRPRPRLYSDLGPTMYCINLKPLKGCWSELYPFGRTLAGNKSLRLRRGFEAARNPAQVASLYISWDPICPRFSRSF